MSLPLATRTAQLTRLATGIPASTASATATRAFGSWSLSRQSQLGARAQRTSNALPSKLQYTSASTAAGLQFQRQFIRKNSSSRTKDDRAPALKQWVFEDIKSTLPPQTPHPILIDVREPAELLSTGIIPSAVCVPLASQPDAFFLTAEEFENRFGFPKPGVDEAANVVFYCKAGVRARAAAQLAVQAGYEAERVGVYDGSWIDWSRRGGEVEKWDGGDFE